MSTIQISITLENETIDKLDSVRGLAKRSTVIQSIVSEYLEKKRGNSPIAKNPPSIKKRSSS